MAEVQQPAADNRECQAYEYDLPSVSVVRRRGEHRALQRLVHGQLNTSWMIRPERTVRRHWGSVLSASSGGRAGTPDFGSVDQRVARSPASLVTSAGASQMA